MMCSLNIIHQILVDDLFWVSTITSIYYEIKYNMHTHSNDEKKQHNCLHYTNTNSTVDKLFTYSLYLAFVAYI